MVGDGIPVRARMTIGTVANTAKRWSRTVFHALGVGVGAALGQYAGIHLLIPLLATATVWWVSKRWLSTDRHVIVATLAVNAGHFLWLAIALALRGVLNADVADLVVYAVGLTWLVSRPGVGPLYLLGAYQAFSLTVNALALLDVTVGSEAHKALLVAVIWRALALIAIGQLWVGLRQQRKTNEATA